MHPRDWRVRFQGAQGSKSEFLNVWDLFGIGSSASTLWQSLPLILNVKLNCWLFAALFLTISVAPNDVIWKHELNVRIHVRKRLASGSIPKKTPFNDSGGVSISGSCTFPDLQHIPVGPFLNLNALQCRHFLSIAPISTFKWA